MVIKLRRQNLVTVYLTLQLAAFAGLGQVLPLADSQDEFLASSACWELAGPL